MKVTRIVTRSALAAAILALAGCQTAPQQQGAAGQPTDSAAAATATTTAPSASTEMPTQAAAEQGVPVAVFLADMTMQEGWRAIPVGGDSTIYLNPQPVVTRDDLTGIQAGANQQGQGLLALMLNDSARTRVQELTSRNPNKRLALVVGRTLMAAPGYTEPVATGQLIFPVGTEENATAAARAIAGVDTGGTSAQPQPAGGTLPPPQ